MSGYTAIIAEAVPGLTQTQYDTIEDTMRHVIFHSTLDWQTREQLHAAARQVFFVILLPADLDEEYTVVGVDTDGSLIGRPNGTTGDRDYNCGETLEELGRESLSPEELEAVERSSKA